MRLSKVVALDESRAATVRELTVAEVRQLLSEHSTLKQAPTMELLRANHGEASALLVAAIDLPEGEVFDELPLSELLMINAAFLDVNKALFQLAAAMEQVAVPPDRQSPSSIASAQD